MKSEYTTQVTIPDSNLNKIVHAELLIPMSEPLTSEDLARLIFISARNSDITDLTGMEYCINLRYADFSSNKIRTLTPLAGNQAIQHLDISYNFLKDIEAIATIINIQNLNLACVNQALIIANHIDLSPLLKLTKLNILDISTNQITICDVISQLISLTELTAKEFEINTEESQKLSKLVNLTKLITSDGHFTNIDFLSGMPDINYIELSRCSRFSDTTPFKNLSKLEYLAITQNNMMRDITPITENSSIKTLHFTEALISPDPITNMNNLTELQINHCGVTNFNFIVGCTNLINLNANSSTVTDISPVSTLPHLQTLTIQYSSISDLLSLKNCKALTTLSIMNSFVTSFLPVLDIPTVTWVNGEYNFLTSQEEYDMLKSRFGDNVFISYNYIYERPEQFAFSYDSESIVITEGESKIVSLPVYYTDDGSQYVQLIADSMLKYCSAKTEDSSIASVTSEVVTPGSAGIDCVIHGSSSGSTLFFIKGANESVDLPFVSGNYSLTVNVA